MDIQTKQEKLKQIYDDFEIRARPFKSDAVCTKGCAFCCTHFGNVDAITLEGLIIHEWIETLDKQDQINIRKKIAKNMKKREKRSDETGYSGHISYILHLIATPDFRTLYTSGGFNPANIMRFGKKYGIIINRMVSKTTYKHNLDPPVTSLPKS